MGTEAPSPAWVLIWGTAAPPSDDPRRLTGRAILYSMEGAGQVWWWSRGGTCRFKKYGTQNGALWYSRETS